MFISYFSPYLPIYQALATSCATVSYLSLPWIMFDTWRACQGWGDNGAFCCVRRARLNVAQGANVQDLLRPPGPGCCSRSAVSPNSRKSVKMNCILIWKLLNIFHTFSVLNTLLIFVFIFTFIYLFRKTVLVWTVDNPTKRFIPSGDAVQSGQKKNAVKFLITIKQTVYYVKNTTVFCYGNMFRSFFRPSSGQRS
jgi:hypothetical protein